MENLKFLDAEHQEAYEKFINQVAGVSVYNKSLLYLLSITEDTRKHINTIYDFETDQIEFEALNEAWQTTTSSIVCKLAFNLFNGFKGIEEEEAGQYVVDNIFGTRTELAQYFYEAIKIRFEIV